MNKTYLLSLGIYLSVSVAAVNLSLTTKALALASSCKTLDECTTVVKDEPLADDTKYSQLITDIKSLDTSQTNKREIRDLLDNAAKRRQYSLCSSAPSKLSLISTSVAFDTRTKELDSALDGCIKALNIEKVDGVLAERTEAKKKIVDLKNRVDEYIRYVAVSPGVHGNPTITQLKAFEDNFKEKANNAIELNPTSLEVPPWSNKLLSYQFYAGAEAISVNDFLEDTSIRVGFQIYHRFSRKIEDWRQVTERKCTLVFKCGTWHLKPGLHTYFNANITGVQSHTFVEARASENTVGSDTNNSADESPEMPNEEGGEGQSENDDEETARALVAEFGVFLPFYTRINGDFTTDNYHEFMAGLILNTSVAFTDDNSDRFRPKYYAGVRLANNEESYFDIMIGRHEGIDGLRGELRGQHPVSTLGGGRVFLGGRFNFGMDGDKDLNEDAWQIYVQWQTSFDELWQRSDEADSN